MNGVGSKQGVGRRIDRGRAPPESDLEARLAAVWRAVLEVPALGVEDNFFDLGGNSITGVRLTASIEREIGLAVPLATLMTAQTIRAMAAALEGDRRPKDRWPIIQCMRTGTDPRAIFLVATPNANALGYAALARRIDTAHPVYVLQRRARDESELGRPYTDEEIGRWAAAYLEAVRAVQPKGPYLLAGMCIGAFIAFEMARRIEADGERVALLGVLDTWTDENTRDPLMSRIFSVERTLTAVRELPRAQQIRWAKGRVERLFERALGKTKPAAAPAAPRDAAWVARYFPPADYKPPQVACRITVFRTEDQPYWRIDDEALGWGGRSSAGVDLRPIAGRHPLFMREPEVRVLANQMRLSLRAAGIE